MPSNIVGDRCDLLQDWTQFAAPAVFGVAMRLYASTELTGARPVHNLVISNVPAADPAVLWDPRSRRCTRSGRYSTAPGLNITVMSLNGKLDVGIVSCPELLPDLWDLADDFGVALDECWRAPGRPQRRGGLPGLIQGHGSMWCHELPKRSRVRIAARHERGPERAGVEAKTEEGDPCDRTGGVAGGGLQQGRRRSRRHLGATAGGAGAVGPLQVHRRGNPHPARFRMRQAAGAGGLRQARRRRRTARDDPFQGHR